MVMLAQSPPMAVDERQLEVPTSSANYTLGQEVEFRNIETGLVDRYVYAKAHAALTQYAPYIIYTAASTAGGSEVVTAAPVVNTAQQVVVGVPQVAFTSSYYGFIKTKGLSTCVASSGLVASTFGRLASTRADIWQGSTGATQITTDFCANGGATSSGTDANISVRLFGNLVSVATST